MIAFIKSTCLRFIVPRRMTVFSIKKYLYFTVSLKERSMQVLKAVQPNHLTLNVFFLLKKMLGVTKALN